MASLLNSVNCRKMTKRGATMDELKAEDCICPVCLSILIEPVTMPCNHELCMACFKQNVQETSLSCPMCRMRISTWTRRTTKQNNLVNQERWAIIQKMFPEKVKQRLEGKDDSLLDDDLLPIEKPLIASPGAIRKEFEYQLRRLQEERRQQEVLEQQASEKLIKKIQAEEKQLEGKRRKQLAKQKLSDEILARTLNEQLKDVRGNGNDSFVLKECLKAYRLRAIRTSLGRKFIQEQTVARSKSANDVLDDQSSGNIFLKNGKHFNYENKHVNGRSSSPVIIKEIIRNKSKENVEVIYQESEAEEDISKDKENINKLPKCGNRNKSPTSSRSRSCSASSDDSISQELTHFKPIKTAPKTPPKKLPGGSVVEAKIVRITPLKCDENNVNMAALKQSPIVKRQLAILDRERRLKVAEMSKATETALENKLNPMPPASKRLTFDDSPETVQRNRRKIFFPLDSNLTIAEQTSTYTYQPKVINSTKVINSIKSPGKVYIMNSKSAKHKKYKSCEVKGTRSESVSELMEAGSVIRDTPFKLPTPSNLIEKPIIKDSGINTRLHIFLLESGCNNNSSNGESSLELNKSLATDSDNTDDEIELNLNKVLKKASIRKKLLIIESDHEGNETEKKPKKRKQHYANIENTKENIKSTTNQIEHKYKACSKSSNIKHTEKSQDSTKYNHKSRIEIEKAMQEEIDYQFALGLQQQFDKEGQNIYIRKRDSEDWYEFRSRSEKTLVPCKKSRCSYKCK